MRDIAIERHAGQFRRDGVTPYINHVEDVAHRVRNAGDLTIALAWGHDLIEDGRITAQELMDKGIPKQVMVYLAMLTFPPRLSIDDYHQRVSHIAPYSVVRDVKLADNLSNLSDSPSEKQIEKYTGSIDILLSYAVRDYTGKHKLCNKS